MKRAFASGCGPNLFLPLMEMIELRKPFKFCSNDLDEWSKRTRGIEINVLLDHVDQKISLWDLAGQEEYHAFHDMMMPDLSSQGNVSYFLLVCNPFDRESGERKSPETIKEELRSWLRFISSNTKRSFNFPPHITIVMTNADKGLIHKEFVESDVKVLANQFRKYINLSSKLHSINAHSSQKARHVVDDVTTTCTNVLDKLPHVFGACVNVQHGLSDWIKEHPYQPIVAMETFKNDIVAKKEPSLQPMPPMDTHDKNLNPHEAVALFLHDAGEIIYFKDEDFVVVNPHWFCHQVMGHLIELRRHAEESQLTTTSEDGLITVCQVESLLKSLKNASHWVGMDKVNTFQNLIQLMIKMDFAYKDDMVNHQGDHVANLQPDDMLFVPTTLEFKAVVARGERHLQWLVKFPTQANCIYIGRRLQCRDEDVTTFTPGFFPRVQVRVLPKHIYFSIDIERLMLCN
jgi:GTPase SAR1 family protein